MSNKIEIIHEFPIIATKDAEWVKTRSKNLRAESGAIWVLPDDAVLIMPPKVDPTKKGSDENN